MADDVQPGGSRFGRLAGRPLLGVVALAALAGDVRADPILELPPVGRGGLLGPPVDGSDRVLERERGRRRRSAAAAGSTDPTRLPGRTGTSELALVAEMNAYGVLGAEPTTSFPEVGGLEGGEPELARMRVGLVGWSAASPVGFSLRADLAEGLRLDGDDFRRAPAAAVDRILDDAVGAWTPRAWAQLWVGRQPVVFSRFRHGEQALLSGGGAPFLVDRVAPDRRWGAAFHGDLGALAYAAGAYADLDRLELRARPPDQEPPGPGPPVPMLPDEPILLPDPSLGGRSAVAAHVEWTPRAPMGPGSAPTPSWDPWHDTARASLGAGALWRWRESGQRVDLSLSAGGKLRGLAALAELVLSVDGDRVALGGAGEVSALFGDRLLLFVRGDTDAEVGWWAAGPGASYFATRDRWNRVSIFGWVRRERDDEGPNGDGVIVQLEAAL